MSKNQIITALDIGSSKIATVIAQRSAQTGNVNVIGAASVDSRGVRKGQIVNIEEATQSVIQSVEAAERMAGVNINHLYLNISSQDIGTHNSQGVVAIANPEGEIVTEDVLRVIEAAQAISLPSSQEIIHVLPMSFTVDAQAGIRDPVGMSGVRLEVATHIVTASVTLARNLNKIVNEIGAQLDQLVFSGLASSYSVLTETEKELGVVLVDIGGGTTNVAIFIEGSLAYSSVIPIGAKNVTNDIAIGLRVSLESAERIKLFLGTEQAQPQPMREEPQSAKRHHRKPKSDAIDLSALNLKEEVGPVSQRTLVEGIIKPRLYEIFDMVGRQIQQSGLGHAVPSGLVITGGGSQTVATVDAARKSLSLPVRIGTPSGLTGLVEDISAPAYATTIGLVLYALEHEVSPEQGFRVPFSSSHPGQSLGGVAGRLIGMVKSLLP